MVRPPPVTDSPLFWLLLFGSVGLVMLAAVEPKFAQRQQRIERMQQSRQLGRQSGARSADGRTPPARSETPVWEPTRRATLRPLALFLAAVLAAAMALMYIRRQRSFAASPIEQGAENEGRQP